MLWLLLMGLKVYCLLGLSYMVPAISVPRHALLAACDLYAAFAALDMMSVSDSYSAWQL